MASLDDPNNTLGKLIAASEVNSTSVYNAAGEKVGTIEDVVLDKISGTTEYVIMSYEGILGIGDKHYPLPWRALTYDPAQEGYVVNIDHFHLESAPSFSAGEKLWGDTSYARRVDEYYASDTHGGGVGPKT